MNAPQTYAPGQPPCAKCGCTAKKPCREPVLAEAANAIEATLGVEISDLEMVCMRPAGHQFCTGCEKKGRRLGIQRKDGAALRPPAPPPLPPVTEMESRMLAKHLNSILPRFIDRPISRELVDELIEAIVDATLEHEARTIQRLSRDELFRIYTPATLRVLRELGVDTDALGYGLHVVPDAGESPAIDAGKLIADCRRRISEPDGYAAVAVSIPQPTDCFDVLTKMFKEAGVDDDGFGRLAELLPSNSDIQQMLDELVVNDWHGAALRVLDIMATRLDAQRALDLTKATR